MQRLDGQLVVSPTDLVRFDACRHLSDLDRQVALGLLEGPKLVDPLLQLFADEGMNHERRYLSELHERGLAVVEIDIGEQTEAGLSAAHERTVIAMRSGIDVVYQATFSAPPWRGQADFLLKVDTASDLGDWGYEATDTKLHKDPRRGDWLQLSFYAEQLRRIQGTTGELMHIMLGDGTVASSAVADHADDYRALTAALMTLVAEGSDVYPEPNTQCSKCRWQPRCREQWAEDDHLSLVGVDRRTRPKLIAGGIATVAALAALPAGVEVESVRPDTLRRLRSDAKLLLHERRTGVAHYRLRWPRDGKGLAVLPSPSPGDAFFDMEGAQYTPSGQLEYLFGVTVRGGTGFEHFSWSAHDSSQERGAFEATVDFLIERVSADPEMHIYHYNHYEPTALRRLAASHQTREAEVESLCDGYFVDLLPIVRDSIRTSSMSSGLKAIEKFYRRGRDGEVADAASSMVEYNAWLSDHDDARLESIRNYNREDCESLAGLLGWLESLADEVRGAAPDRLAQEPDAQSAAETATIPDLRDRLTTAAAGVAEFGTEGAVGALLRRTVVAIDFEGLMSAGAMASAVGADADAVERWLLRGKKELGVPIALERSE